MFCGSRRFKTTRYNTSSSSKREVREVFLNHIDLYASSLLLHYCMLSLNWIPTYTFSIGICVWLVLLSPAVMSVVQVFHLYDVEYGLCLCVRGWSSIHRDVSWPWWGSMLWFEQGMFWPYTWCTDGIVDHLQRYLLVQSGKVVGLERCPWYGVFWKDNSFTESNARIS
jgi:hypothetical protein